MRIAVLGLGHMGAAMAQRLMEAGHEVHVWNRTPGRAAGLVGLGAIEAHSTTEAVRDTSIVITSLADDAAVREVCLGPGGVAASLGSDALLGEASTVAPATSRAVASAMDGRFVDAPILGGPAAVLSGQAILLMGGEDSNIDRVDPLLAAFSAQRLRCGPAGAGVTVKVLANQLLLTQLTSVAEAVASAQANGVRDDLIALLGRSGLVPENLKNRWDDLVAGDHRGWFSMRLGRKDAQLALDLASGAGLDLAVARAVDQLFSQGIDAGLGDLDIAAVIEAVRARRLTGAVRP